MTLSLAEYHAASYVGFARALRAVARDRRGDSGHVAGGYFSTHVDGAVAEYAVARTFRWFWRLDDETDSGRGDFVDGDGNRYEVRHTRRSDGRLMIHPGDPDEHYAILVRGIGLSLTIVGVVLIANGKQREFWQAEWDRPCFLVPDRLLLPLGSASTA